MYGMGELSWWYMTHRNPIETFKEIKRVIKYGYQRLTRGWDDSWWWGIDHMLVEFMPEWLDQMIKHGMSTPIDMEESEWNSILTEIKEGFLAGKQIINHDFPSHNELFDAYFGYTEKVTESWKTV